MFTFLVTLLICLMAVSAITPEEQREHPNFELLPQPPECSNPHASDRIVGGDFANMGQFPWIARLGYNLPNCDDPSNEPIYSCGGSLISTTVVLTASHCLANPGTRKCPATDETVDYTLSSVLLGEHDITKTDLCGIDACGKVRQSIPIKRIVEHGDYDKAHVYNDIALLELEYPAEITEWVNPICLPVGDMLAKNYIGELSQVAGWGRTGNIGEQADLHPDVLKFVYLPVKDNAVCSEYFTLDTNRSQLCVGGGKDEDSCTGDSGGPLMVVDSDGGPPKEYQMGLVSYGVVDCGSDGIPGVYTDIREYMDWILDNLTE